MVQEIYIIDDDDSSIVIFRELFKNDKDYKFIKGFAASSDTGKTDVNWHMRSFWVKSGSKKVYVEARTSYVHVGDYIEVLYLPNSHLGTVIRRTESEE